MKKKEKKPDVMTRALAAKSQEESEQILKEHYSQQPIYNVFNFFIGGPNKVGTVDSHVEGKPSQPPY